MGWNIARIHPTPPHSSPTQPIPAPCQAELTSPEGFPVIVAAVHNRDGDFASSQGNDGMRMRAAWGASIIQQVVELSGKRRREEAAKGQRIGHAGQLGPSIIVAGEFNITLEVLLDAIAGTMPIYDAESNDDTSLMAFGVGSGSLFAISDRELNPYESLPAIRGADGNKGVDGYDICFDKPVLPPDRPPQGQPLGHTRVGDEADLERSTQKLKADMQSARKAQELADSAPPRKKPKLEDSPSPHRRATTPSTPAAPPWKKPRLEDSPSPRRRATSPAEKKKEEPTSPVAGSEQGSQAAQSHHRRSHAPSPSRHRQTRLLSPTPTPIRHRRDGLPIRALVQREADVFVVTNLKWQRLSLSRVLYLRSKEVLLCAHATDVILDKTAVTRVKKTLYREWHREKSTLPLKVKVWKNAQVMAKERRRQGERASPKDCYDRSMKSYWKTVVFHRYGGEMWLDMLIATGHVNAAVVQIVNEVVANKILLVAKRAPVHDPEQAQPSTRPRSLALASSQGQVRGVNHHHTPAHVLRDQARYADKQVTRHDKEWHWWSTWGNLRGQCESWRERSIQLREKADRLWAEATKESIKAGQPFKQRDGTMWHPERSPQNPQKGNLEKALGILKARIEKGDLKWPPAPDNVKGPLTMPSLRRRVFARKREEQVGDGF